jgi:hypothetical protein
MLLNILTIVGFVGLFVAALLYHELFFQWIEDHMSERKM